MIKIKEAVIVEGKYDKIKLSSIIDTVIITPAAKLRELATILSLFLNLKRINIVPNRVEKPAKVVNKKAK